MQTDFERSRRLWSPCESYLQGGALNQVTSRRHCYDPCEGHRAFLFWPPVQVRALKLVHSPDISREKRFDIS